jgi:hypothetical protein
MRIQEIFDSEYKWKWIPRSGGISVLVDAPHLREFRVEFDQLPSGGFLVAFVINLSYKTAARNDKTEFKIFGTVIKIIEATINEFNVAYLTFTSAGNEENRAKLYKRIASKIAKRNGYEVVTIYDRTEHFMVVIDKTNLYAVMTEPGLTSLEFGSVFSTPEELKQAQNEHGVDTFDVKIL